MAEGDRPSGLGWPIVKPRSTDAPRPTSEPRSADTPKPTSQPSPAGDNGTAGDDTPVWSLSSADQHDLWLSFLGSIVSGVVLAVVLGGGIALARAFHSFGLGNLAVLTLVFGFSSFAFIMGAWIGRRRREATLTEYAKQWIHFPGWLGWLWWLGWVMPGFAFAILMVLILTWIGLAAGIK
jgi:hypothetical protein